MANTKAILRALKAAQTRAQTAPAVSPAAAQYQQWTSGYAAGLPRPGVDFRAGSFGPLVPIEPAPIDMPAPGEERPEPRRWEYPVGWNMPIGVPGSEGLKLASFDTLRTYADLYSVARTCIRRRRDELAGLRWDIQMTTEAEKAARGDKKAHRDFQERRAKVLKFFRRPDPNYADFSSWFNSALEDLMVIDALSVYLHPSRRPGAGLLGSDLAALDLLDGSTIRPLVDLHGATPAPPAVAYQQYLWGVPRADLMTIATGDDVDEGDGPAAEYRGDQLLYLPYTRRTWTPYGYSAIEGVVLPLVTGLMRQKFAYDFFQEGSIPGTFVSPGDTSLTANQVREMQDALNAMAGDPAWKHKIVVLPGGSHVDPMKPGSLADAYDEVVTAQVAMAFDIQPQELGAITGRRSAAGEQQNKRVDPLDRPSNKPLLLWLKATIFDRILRDVCGQDDMVWTWEGLDSDPSSEQIGALKDQITTGLMSIDEGRQELGHMPWGLPMTSDPGILTATGFVPLGSIDPETGKPLDDQPAQSPAAGNAPAGPGTPAGPVAPLPPSAGADSASRGGTPSHDAAQAPTPPGKVPQKAAASELDALRRHLTKGRAVDSWTPRYLEGEVLDAVAAKLAAGASVVDAVADGQALLAKQVAWDPSEHPRAPAGGATGGQFTAGANSDGGSQNDSVSSRLAWVNAKLKQLEREQAAADRKKKGRKKTGAAKKPKKAKKVSYASHVIAIGKIRDGLDNLTEPTAKRYSKQLLAVRSQLTQAAATLNDGDAAGARAKLLAAYKALTPLAAEATKGDRTVLSGLLHRIETQVETLEPKAERIAHATTAQPARSKKPTAASTARTAAKPATSTAPRVHTTHRGQLNVPGHPLAAPDSTGKAAGPKGWAGWAHDRQLAGYYAPRIAAALSDGIDVHRLAADWLAWTAKDDAGARGWLNGRGLAKRLIAALTRTLHGLWTEGWFLGSRSATAVLHGGPVDWSGWTPGDHDAAALVADDPGLRDLLDRYGLDTIHAIADTRLDELAAVLADSVESGGSAEHLAAQLRAVLDDPGRAQMVADTETARAVSQSALDEYRADGVTAVEWSTAPEGVCAVCEANAEMGAVPIGTAFGHKPGTADAPPAHPGCRCVLLPAQIGDVQLKAATAELVDAAPVDADEPYEQMMANFPPKAIAWMRRAGWVRALVPQDEIDTDDVDSWAASTEPRRVAKFAKKIRNGKNVNPVIAVQQPGKSRLVVIDGHHRTLAYRQLNRPVPAYVGTVPAKIGPWLETASYQQKSAAPSVAGLAVRAADTGRVLMLQRALVDGDPAGGCWEFPGGHTEDGESPPDAARREWSEETGCAVPDGEVTGGWRSSNGVYEGIVLTVPSEEAVPYLGDRDAATNPDDPDGDQVEALAWWDPEQLTDNPALRPELAGDLDRVLPQLTDRSIGKLYGIRGHVQAVKVDQGEAGDVRARHLIRWYNDGADGQIPWGSGGDFDACVAVASRHMPAGKAKGFCANRHHDVLGIWPATHAARLHGKAFDPDQVRGPDGRWISVGGELSGAIHEVSGAMFHRHIAEARNGRRGAFLSLYTPEEYSRMRCFFSDEGRAGGALKDHGDGRVEIVSLYNNGGAKGAGMRIMDRLIAEGGNYCECYGDGLRDRYQQKGFRVDEAYPFDRSQAADDWNYDEFGEPTYYLMSLRK